MRTSRRSLCRIPTGTLLRPNDPCVYIYIFSSFHCSPWETIPMKLLGSPFLRVRIRSVVSSLHLLLIVIGLAFLVSSVSDHSYFSARLQRRLSNLRGDTLSLCHWDTLLYTGGGARNASSVDSSSGWRSTASYLCFLVCWSLRFDNILVFFSS